MEKYFRFDLADKNPVQINVMQKKVMLCLNESTFDPWQAVQEDFLRLMHDVHLNRYYSWLTDSLKNELAAYASVPADMLIMGNGADELLYYLFLSVNDPGAFALTLTPSYFDYLSYSRAVGLNLKTLPLKVDFSFDTAEFLKLADDPHCRLLIICNPNNPTGNLFPQDQIKDIVTALPHRLVLLDETYYEFSGVTWVDQLTKYPNLLLIRSFSKAFSAAGLRFGYLLANSELCRNFRKVVTAFNLSIFTQALAFCILKNKDSFLDHNMMVIAQRETLLSALEKFPQLTVFPSQTNFITFRCPDSARLSAWLLSQDVALRDISRLPGLENCLRLTCGTPQQNNLVLILLESFYQ